MPNYGSMREMIEAAERGDLDTQHHVGACYATGDWDGPKDAAQAIQWYTRAAEAGHPLSQYDLGFMLMLGEGTEKDIEKGLWWIEQAANNGEAHAARLLADIYETGHFEVIADPNRAKYWQERYEELRKGI